MSVVCIQSQISFAESCKTHMNKEGYKDDELEFHISPRDLADFEEQFGKQQGRKVKCIKLFGIDVVSHPSYPRGTIYLIPKVRP